MKAVRVKIADIPLWATRTPFKGDRFIHFTAFGPNGKVNRLCDGKGWDERDQKTRVDTVPVCQDCRALYVLDLNGKCRFNFLPRSEVH